MDSEQLRGALRKLMEDAVRGKISFDDARLAYENLDECVAKWDQEDSEALRARRAIAAGKLTVAQVLHQPVDVCAPLFDAVLSLGFDGGQDRLLQVGAFARYCYVNGRGGMAEHLDGAIAQARREFPHEELEPYEALLTKLRKSESGAG